MAEFPDSVKQELYDRSNGRCECKRQHPGLAQADAPHHGGRCPITFTRYGGSWHAHHVVAGGPDVKSNGEALCIKCHQLTQTYGSG